jgi:hypothetical protein
MANDKIVQNAAEIIMRCFEARTITHILHLRTRSFEAHVALGEFYEGIVGLVDGFAEAFQGVYDIIPDYPVGFGFEPKKDYREGIRLLVDLRGHITRLRTPIPCSELQNSLDEIVALIDRTAYKLRFLK